MSQARRRYSRELKLEAVRRVLETGTTQAEIARELDLSPNTLSTSAQKCDDVFAEAHAASDSSFLAASIRRRGLSRSRRVNFQLNGCATCS